MAGREEAEYLALELHDGLLQVLSGNLLLLCTSAVDCIESGKYFPAKGLVQTIEKAAQFCINECYEIMGVLKGGVVDTLGLLGAIQTFWHRIPGSRDIRLRLPQTDPDMSMLQKRHLYRVAQAALGNVIKYAHAKEVQVRISEDHRQFRFEIEDDGVGFDPVKVHGIRGHYGLAGIEQRARSIGGTTDIKSHPGGPSIITVFVPKGAQDERATMHATIAR